MEKHYISANELLQDSFKLAEQIFKSGYRPDFIIGVWRGGTPVAIAIQEYFDYLGVVTDHIPIRTSSYTGINQQDKKVSVYGLDYIVDNIKTKNKVLLVDDVFDSGRSILTIYDRMKLEVGRNMPKEIKVATPWYKPSKNTTDIEPDFYMHETDKWLVFPHEVCGLTHEEIRDNKPEIAETISNQKARK